MKCTTCGEKITKDNRGMAFTAKLIICEVCIALALEVINNSREADKNERGA